MKNFNILKISLVVLVLISGCNPLKKMIQLSEQQQINVNPDPILMKGGNVVFDVETTLPVGMLPKGTSYTLNFEYDGKEAGSQEFKASDYPNSARSVSKATKTISFPFDDSMVDNPQKLSVVGNAKIVATGTNLNTESTVLADGVNSTQRFNEAWNLQSPKAYPGYTDEEETEVTTVNFFFNQGSAYLRGSEKKSDRGEQFSAFVAERNVTKSVNITGAHSPEGSTKVNESLAGRRASAIEKYYRAQMDRYDYKDEAGDIGFNLVPVVENWDALRRALRSTSSLTSAQRSQIGAIINGGGSFVDKEKSLSKLNFYNTLMKEVYPDLRTARTEVTTVIEKKPNNEILAIAQKIVSGEASSDALTHGELLFAARLTPDLGEKAAIYGSAVKWGGTWEAHNDFGSVHIQLAKEEENGSEAQLKLLEDGETQLNISLTKKENIEAYLNLAASAALKYDWGAANDYLAKAKEVENDRQSMSNVLHNSMGALAIAAGNHEEAIALLSKVDGQWGAQAWAHWRTSIAHLVLNDHVSALKSLNNLGELFKANEWDLFANYYYVLAVCGARSGNSDAVSKNLSSAFSMESDIDLKNKAINDLEFRSYSDAVQAAMN